MSALDLPETTILVAQGEFEVGSGAGVVLTTILGSCVAACIWDPVNGIGGMNHIVLPDAPDADQKRASVGVNAMELLINGIIKKGGVRGNLQAKLFGGARMIAGLSNVGERNAAFALEFLEREAIPCRSTSLGGESGRRVQFWPASGRARQKMMSPASVQEVTVPVFKPSSPPADVELF